MKRICSMLLLVVFLLPAAVLAEVAEVYELAENLLAERRYTEAAAMYDSIIGYEDAADCGMYARALEAAETGKFAEAKLVFEYLGGFRDSEMLCYFLDILQLEATGEYREAIKACNVVPYSYYGRIQEKYKDMKSKYEYHGYSFADICGSFIIVRHDKTGLYGVIGLDGQEIIPCDWENLTYGNDSYFITGEKVDEKYKYGIISVSGGKMTVPCEWERIEFITENRVAVGANEDYWIYGIISAETGEMILPCEYRITDYSANGYTVVMKEEENGRQYRLVDIRDGRIVIDGAAYIELPASDDPITVALAQEGIVHLFEGKKDQYPQEAFEGLEVFDSVLALVSGDAENRSAKVYVTEERVLEVTEDTIVLHELPEEDGGLRAVRKDGFYGFVDDSGTEVIACEWDRAESFVNGLSLVKKDEKWGCIDTSGRLVLESEWDHIQILSKNTALCFKGEMKYSTPKEGESYVVDLVRGTASAADYVYTSWGYDAEAPAELFRVTKGGMYGMIDASGDLVIPCCMSSIDPLEDGYLHVLDESWMSGVYNLRGEKVIPCKYSWLDYENGIFALISGGRSEGYLTITDIAGNTLF